MIDFDEMMGQLSRRARRERRERERAMLRLPPWEREHQRATPMLLHEQRNLATISRETLTADAMTIALDCGGFAYAGWGITGTWTGTVYFEAASMDNPNVWFADSQTPFPSGTNVSSATANGNWFSVVNSNILRKRARFSRTTGSVIVYGAVANDSSWQDAFLTSSQKAVSSAVTSGINTLTQTAQANRAWTLTSLSVSFASPGVAGGVPRVTVYDGTILGTVLFDAYINQPSVAGSIGWSQDVSLPRNAEGNQSVAGTPGNAVTIVLRGINGSSIINSNFTAGG